MIIAHLTDPHLFLGRPSPVEWAGKRGLSYANWLRRRRHLHRPEIAGRIVADVTSAEPDYIVMTGDLVNFSLDREIAAGAGWLAALGPPERVGVVPGNHDALVGGFERALARHWGPYLAGDDGSAGFPWLRRRGEVALIGLSSAVATPPFFATGTVGAVQREALGRILDRTGREGLCRIVLVHHAPTPLTLWRKRLTDGPALSAMIARHGAELVLHGHNHRAELSWIDAARGRVPVIGAPSCSMRPGAGHDAAAWFRIEVARAGAGWRLTLAERRIDSSGVLGDVPRLELLRPGPELAGPAAAP
ncbi:MAG TPA: metallophosphoesterase [Thermohalobaculum sp.]|nr:metallophosphoesterase [Thermohalobaculum sp.]